MAVSGPGSIVINAAGNAKATRGPTRSMFCLPESAGKSAEEHAQSGQPSEREDDSDPKSDDDPGRRRARRDTDERAKEDDACDNGVARQPALSGPEEAASHQRTGDEQAEE